MSSQRVGRNLILEKMEKTDVHVGKGDVDGAKKQRGCSKKSVSRFPSLKHSSKGKVLNGDGVKNTQRDEMDGDCKCQVCGQKFAHEANLEKHMITTHSSGKSIEVENGYQCSVCYEKFTTLGNIRSHLRMHYEENILLQVSCALCGERFGHQYQLNRHRCDKLDSTLQLIKNSVKGKACDYKCAVCDTMLSCKQSWEIHMNIHLGQQKLQCQLCSLKFSTKLKLKSHLRQHTEDYPLKCSWCPRRFHAKWILKGHERLHEKAWRSCYVCCMCRKSFVQQRNMQAHKCQVEQKGHVTKYLCNVCGESHAFISTLKIHMKAHLTTHPHTCFRCGKGFQSKESFTKHYMRLRVLSSSLIEDKTMGKKNVRNYFACGTKKRMGRPQKSLQTACTKASPNKEKLIKKSEDNVPKMYKGERSQCRCALCGETVLCKFELKRHRCQSLDSELLQSDKESLYIRWQNSKSKAYQCPVCNKMFKTTYSWQGHMAVHLGQEKYKCPVCPRKFLNDRYARVHYTTFHTKGHPFKGKWCLSSYVNYHEEIHNQALQTLSGRSGSNKETAIHYVDEDEVGSESKLTEERRAKYRCDACCKKFSHLAGYRKHVNKKHVNKKHTMGVINKEGLPFCCALCGERFPLRYHLNRHRCVALDTKVLEGTNVYDCAVCNRNFVLKLTWEAHMSLHLVKQEQQCPVCCLQIYDGKEFDARFHMRTHDGESMPNEIEAKEKYLCSVCGKRNEFNPNLENRAIGVTDPNPYLCSLCTKRLGCKVNLTHQTEEQTEEHLLSRSQDSTSCVDDQGLCENQVMPYLTKHRHEENANSPDIYTKEVEECLDDSDSKVMPASSRQNIEEKYPCFLCDKRLGTEDELKSHLQVHCS